MSRYKFFLTMLALAAATAPAYAQQGVEMADGLRSSGKIYVVVAVLLLIFIGIVIFLIFLERRIRNIENRFNK